jgi:DNA-binding Lrp family transcriptional regulator
MFASVADSLPGQISKQPHRLFLLKEPTVGNVIPDLLLGEWSDDLRPLRRNFTFIEARIIALLDEHDELFEAEIADMLHLSEPAAARAFKRIERSGVTIETAEGKISLDAGAFTRALVVTAVELKLSRWREALAQGVSYLKFADRAYVVLDADRAEPDEAMIAAFRASRVGLFMLGAEMMEVVPAIEQGCVGVQRILAVQKLCVSLTASGRLQSSLGAPIGERF